MLEYIGSGGVRVGGCAVTTPTPFYIADFTIGTIVYLRAKAMKGVLEKIAIKEALQSDLNRRHSSRIMLYKDTNNFIYGVNELVTYDEAIALVEAYTAAFEAKQAEYALKCR